MTFAAFFSIVFACRPRPRPNVEAVPLKLYIDLSTPIAHGMVSSQCMRSLDYNVPQDLTSDTINDLRKSISASTNHERSNVVCFPSSRRSSDLPHHSHRSDCELSHVSDVLAHQSAKPASAVSWLVSCSCRPAEKSPPWQKRHQISRQLPHAPLLR